MKVLIVGDHPPPAGGISVHVEALGALLRSDGFRVETLDVTRPKRSPGAIPDVVAARNAAHLAAVVLDASARGAIVHVHVCGHHRKSWFLAGAVTALSAPWAPPPLVTVHSGLAPAYLARPAARWLAGLACRPAGRVICANAEIAASLRLAGVRPGRLEVLPAFLSSSLRTGRLPSEFRAFQETAERLVIACLGIGPEYGAPLLIDAFEAALRARPGLRLVTVGPGGGEAFRRAAGRRGLAESVLALGELPHPATLAVMDAADLFVRPTLADGDANSVREALAFGLPVVATSVAPRPDGVRAVEPTAAALATALTEAPPRTARRAPRAADARLLEIYRALASQPVRLAATQRAS